MDKKELLAIAVEAALEAGRAILTIYEKGQVTAESKEDSSPLTAADVASNEIINTHLKNTNIPIISEENKEIPYPDRKNWSHCWIVDPLDGTKEFIKRNGEFTVNIAYVVHGVPQLGVIYVPASRQLYYADVSQRHAYKNSLTTSYGLQEPLFSNTHRIAPKTTKDGSVRIVASKSHMNQETKDFIATLKQRHSSTTLLSKGSSLKFCLLAEGHADVYPRFAPTMEWDTAAGHAICNAVGLKVVSKDTNKELLYNKENLKNSSFVVAGGQERFF